jgi:hypothetical protein
MGKVSAKYVEKIETHFIVQPFFPDNLAVHEIMWTGVVQPDRL